MLWTYPIAHRPADHLYVGFGYVQVWGAVGAATPTGTSADSEKAVLGVQGAFDISPKSVLGGGLTW